MAATSIMDNHKPLTLMPINWSTELQELKTNNAYNCAIFKDVLTELRHIKQKLTDMEKRELGSDDGFVIPRIDVPKEAEVVGGFTKAFDEIAENAIGAQDRMVTGDENRLRSYITADIRTVTLPPNTKGEVSFDLTVPNKQIITKIEVMGTYLVEVKLHAHCSEILKLNEQLRTIKRVGIWIDLMQFLPPLPWFGAGQGPLTVTCISSAPVSLQYTLGRAAPEFTTPLTVKCRLMAKCGEGKGATAIRLSANHPTIGLLVLPADDGVPVSATLKVEAPSTTVVIDRLPVEKFRTKGDMLFIDGAYFIRFPRTLNMSRIDSAELTIEGPPESTFKVFNLHENYLSFAGGDMALVFAN